MRRVRDKVQVRLDQIAETELHNPTYETMLLGISDDLDPGEITETFNSDGTIQLLAGFPSLEDFSPANDAEVLKAFITQIGIAVDQCGLTPLDRDRIREILKSSTD